MQARDNPFATDRVEQLLLFRPEWLETDWNSIELRWYALNQRASLTGRHGSGKTTFLDAWRKRLTENGKQVIHLFLNREHRSLSQKQWQALNNPIEKIVLLDGEEQLSWIDRKKFYHLTKSATGLLVTRHKKGKLPTLFHFEPTIDLLDRCVQELAPEYLHQLTPFFPKWWQQTHGNIREVLLKCYDAIADGID